MILVYPAEGDRLEALDLIGEALGSQAEVVAVPVERLPEGFLSLKTGVAGEFMQKFVNYRLQLAVVGDISAHTASSAPLRDFVHETNRGKQIWFLSDLDSLYQRLATEAIQSGSAERLRALLEAHPPLAGAVFGGRSLLHILSDHPGNRPHQLETLRVLLDAGADVNARFVGGHSETPLHWAASNDDVALASALLDAGADIEAGGGIIGNGTPLADAVAFGQWAAARLLVDRGAQVTLWQAAALGLTDRLDVDGAGPEEITNAFWCACHGGQPATASLLLDRGADLNWVGHDGLTPLGAASRSGASTVVDWLRDRGAH